MISKDTFTFLKVFNSKKEVKEKEKGKEAKSGL